MFLSKREGKGATGKMPAREETRIFITLVPRAEWESKKSFTWEAKISLNVGNYDWS